MNEPGTMHTGPLGSTIHRTEAVARVVRRRQRASVRVREEEGAYSRDSREPAAHQGRQESGRTEHRAHHG